LTMLAVVADNSPFSAASWRDRAAPDADAFLTTRREDGWRTDRRT
jgi:hypothetical protein